MDTDNGTSVGICVDPWEKTPVNKDHPSRERRSWNMSRIRGKDTTPEKRVRSLLHRLGYRFRLHVRMPVPFDSLSAWKVPRPSDGRGIKGEGLRESGERAGVGGRFASSVQTSSWRSIRPPSSFTAAS